MKTISSIVSTLVDETPFLQESLSANILNYRAAANYLQKFVDAEMGKKTKIGSVQMALMRYKKPNHITSAEAMAKNAFNLGSLNLNVGLCCLTFKKSYSLLKIQSEFLKDISKDTNCFYLFTYGYSECNLTFSIESEKHLPQSIKMESLVKKTENLNAITLKLPNESENIRGLYYILLKELSWNNVTLYDISSTANEITLIVKDKYINACVETFKSLKFKSL